MKTLEDIKDDYACEHGYDDWNEVIYSSSDPDLLDKVYDRIARRFAKEVAKQALKNASDNSVMKVHDGHFKTDSPSKHVQIGANNIKICKESILNENNIPKL